MAKIKAVDLALAQGLATTRSQAQALILAGRVLCQDQAVKKAGQLLPQDALLTLKEGRVYVSRGGFKLAGALDDLGASFNLDARGLKAMDAGASTGGFTDCLLQRGASSVTAVDVGQGLLDYGLRQDPRVKVVENLNIRHLTVAEAEKNLGAPFDLITADLSFISLELILPALAPLVKPQGRILALVKPQFEVGPRLVGKKGVVRDPAVRQTAVNKIISLVATLKPPFVFLAQCPSRLTGAEGNQEIFVLLARRPDNPNQSVSPSG
ncbi:MAG: TlyA family RNA methyltransferase [Deltaproteobacteria bacterium]|jgi:23S rRNA (cytidine1920-2'-O)/16S rRNA (cytidine1409-2'-O)-methyltransferase|nr:TlyA family RNA methyltransferase [Deltaproteobacteria bacterium]